MNINIFDVTYAINLERGSSMTFETKKHTYVIYFKYTKEFLTSTCQEGLMLSALDKQST